MIGHTLFTVADFSLKMLKVYNPYINLENFPRTHVASIVSTIVMRIGSYFSSLDQQCIQTTKQ